MSISKMDGKGRSYPENIQPKWRKPFQQLSDRSDSPADPLFSQW